MHHPALGLALILDIPAAMIVQFGLVINLRLVVLLGNLRLQVRVAVQFIKPLDGTGD